MHMHSRKVWRTARFRITLILCTLDFPTKSFFPRNSKLKLTIFVQGTLLINIALYRPVLKRFLIEINRFTNPSDPNFVFHPNYHKRIPADGFHVYASGIWEQIMSNKDLDLPTQQELLAQYRCDEIANVSNQISRYIRTLIP
jgi:Root hair defective 3 GTP-binding protein (RHD3)